MSSRYEYKYLVSNELIDNIRNDIIQFMELDDFAKQHSNGQYTVRSIYYDSPKFECYKEKQDGVKIRNKYRIRGYDDQSGKSITFLEIKHKDTNCISKSRAPLYFINVAKSLYSRRVDDYVLSFSGNGVEKKDAHKFLYYYHLKKLHPAVLVIYDREAFLGKFDSSLRVTFDKNLKSIIYPSLNQLYSEEGAKKTMNNHFIFEIKFFGNLPAWIKTLVTKYNLDRRALSKYTMSLETHDEFNNRRFAKSNLISNRGVCYAQ